MDNLYEDNHYLRCLKSVWVAKKLGRQDVGYEISEEYCDLAIERNRQQVMSC